MQIETLLHTLHAHQENLRQRGILSLVCIGSASALSSNQPLHLLVDLAPPRTYQQMRETTLYLSGLLDYPVELVLVNPDHQAVQPYLDPDAIVIL